MNLDPQNSHSKNKKIRFQSDCCVSQHRVIIFLVPKIHRFWSSADLLHTIRIVKSNRTILPRNPIDMRFSIFQVASCLLSIVNLHDFCHGFVPSSTRLSSTTTTTIARPASYLLAEQLNVAFVTGNQVSFTYACA